MKTIVIITHSTRTGDIYARQVLALFAESVGVTQYALEEDLPLHIDADVVLLSAHFIYTLVESRLHSCRHIIIADITLRKSAVEKLRSLPEGTKSMLVNTTMEMAIETINLIHNSGINHIELMPVYPGLLPIPSVNLAITPGEAALVPVQVTNIIDLQDRVLSMRTITNLAAKLNLTALLQREPFKEYFDSLMQGDLGIGRLLGKTAFAAAGQPLETVLPELSDLDIIGITEPIREKVVTVRDQLMDVSVYPLTGTSAAGEYILMIKTMKDVELTQYKVRRQLIFKGHVAKHDFSHIITKDPGMMRLKEMADRMAQSPSSVVIYGQSGTGKELFAQSIHNASPRKDYPFIAINCASIPENLLESELFGYSEGAFTGARKGGKAGYFELAHKGTLFLDEIGEMDLGLQARILRALQEKEVSRVGADHVISIDVRIISASNKRLLDLVRQKRFREDLYYRLNVLSIEIPPLRERREDIPLLIDVLQDRQQTYVTLSSDALEFVSGYPWHGNVRELGNFVERISYLSKDVITLPDAKAQLDEQPEDTVSPQGNPLLAHFFVQERERMKWHAAILSLLYYNKQAGIKQGRDGISHSLAAKGLLLSGQEVRTYLKTLQSYGLVLIHAGRSGTELTALGEMAKNNMDAELGF